MVRKTQGDSLRATTCALDSESNLLAQLNDKKLARWRDKRVFLNYTGSRVSRPGETVSHGDYGFVTGNES